MTNKKLLLAICIFVCISAVIAASALAEPSLTSMEELGEFLYFDENLSQPVGQSCASCHHPDFGFVDPDAELPVSEGVLPNRFGGRNSPSAAYAMYSPTRFFEENEGLWIGGQFWDSRATGHELDDPLADQALGPFTNPVEMANKERWLVVRDVAISDYTDLFYTVWGNDLKAWSRFSDEDIDTAYEQVALSIAAFERTAQFAPFDSQYDVYLQACLEAGYDKVVCATGDGAKGDLDPSDIFSNTEWDGFQLFMGDNNNDGVLDPGEGALCVGCHVAEWTADPGNVVVPNWANEFADGMVPPLFTDFTYDNLGVPQNKDYPLDPNAPVDLGLGAVLRDEGKDLLVYEPEFGKFKVMTLRNVGVTAPYAHNGFFASLKEITHFYNARDVEPLGEPEYGATVNDEELGNLGLTGADEDALVAFMMTLTDARYTTP